MNEIDINEAAILAEVARYTDEGIESVAMEAVERAKNTTAFSDDSGMLRRSIKAQPAKRVKDGEKAWLVRATAPHAHLVEHGHAMVTPGGDLVGHVAAHPFLQPAVDSVMPDAEQIAAAYLKKLNIKV